MGTIPNNNIINFIEFLSRGYQAGKRYFFRQLHTGEPDRATPPPNRASG
jgi:hypothetical protein